MKTLMIPALAALTLPLFAGPAAIRVDVDATKQLIPIKKTAGEGKLSKGHWLPAEKQNSYLYLSKPVTDEWSDFIFTVVPEKSGDIRLNIGGEWSKEPGDREFVLIDDVTVNGEPVANGSFEENDGKKAKNWYFSGKSVTLSDDAKTGKASVKVNHDNRACLTLKAEAGKNYEIKISAKKAEK
ncbi:MAG: hypothetical protein ACI406_16200 [Victivallis vadensis]|uniref:hypothetical protein n=1 Tax=uncultured Victivallis sp. TaxID=354118 RepID=UPI0025952E6E|nr:hypothetical protein [uncultured Victivallis sp.]